MNADTALRAHVLLLREVDGHGTGFIVNQDGIAVHGLALNCRLRDLPEVERFKIEQPSLACTFVRAMATPRSARPMKSPSGATFGHVWAPSLRYASSAQPKYRQSPRADSAMCSSRVTLPQPTQVAAHA